MPKQVVKTALRASQLIGDGLYGVDLKEFGRKVYLVEINDNPSIDVGYEDRAAGDDLYTADPQRLREAARGAARAEEGLMPTPCGCSRRSGSSSSS